MPNKHNPNRGILHYETGTAPAFSIIRRTPSDALRFFVRHYWLAEWDFRGHAPHVQEILQHPGVNMLFQRGRSLISGIESVKSTYLLQGQNQLFGVLFRPGAFACCMQDPLSTLTDRKIPITDVFNVDIGRFEDELFALEDANERVSVVERLLSRVLPEPERMNTIDLLSEVIDAIVSDRDIVSVADVADRFGISKRTLQRLFRQYVGVSPKWVILRYRMHEASERIEKGAIMAQLAVELGYFDQAHFSKNFKAIIGATPEEYAKRAKQASNPSPD